MNMFFYTHLFSEEELPKKDDDAPLCLLKALKSCSLNKKTMSKRNHNVSSDFWPQEIV